MSETKLIYQTEEKPSLEEAQKLVGGLVELVELQNGDQMLVNENAIMDKLPINEKATQIAIDQSNALIWDGIRGDVLILQGGSKMGLSKENAKILWEWKGDRELEEAKHNIKDAKKRLQRLANRCASGKGSLECQLRAIGIISADLLAEIDYLKRVKVIKHTAEL